MRVHSKRTLKRTKTKHLHQLFSFSEGVGNYARLEISKPIGVEIRPWTKLPFGTTQFNERFGPI